MKKLAPAFIAALVLTGCGSVRYPKSYVLNLPPPAPSAAPAPGVLGGVTVREFRCPDYLCEGRIVFRQSPEEVEFYEFHRWAMNPREAITEYMAHGLNARSMFKSVAVRDGGSDAVYVLGGNIERLEEVDQGRDVRAVCSMSAQLIDTRTKSVVWRGAASETVSVDNRTMGGVVSSLSIAARTVADRLLQSMVEQLPARMGDTLRAGPAQ